MANADAACAGKVVGNSREEQLNLGRRVKARKASGRRRRLSTAGRKTELRWVWKEPYGGRRASLPGRGRGRETGGSFLNRNIRLAEALRANAFRGL